MEIDDNKLKRWIYIENLPLKKILTKRQYEVLTSLHGFKNVERIDVKDLALKLNLSQDRIMEIHTQALLRIWGYEMRENL